MHWQKCDVWKIGIILGMLLFFVLITGISGSAVLAHPLASRQAHPRTAAVQVTPTEDATVTALNKEKLAQEVKQLKNQNEQDFLGWLLSNISILLSTLLVVGGGTFGLVRYLAERQTAQDKELKDRQEEREKRVQERFQAAVTGLADDKEGAKIGATIVLRTFLKPGYEEFYVPIFDLAVANLRNPRTSFLLEEPDLPLSPLNRALSVVFREAFPLARRQFARLLTLHAYQHIDGVKGALAQHAESTYQSLPTEKHHRLARALFLRLINPSTVEEDATRRRIPLSELIVVDQEETTRLAEVTHTFTKARLLTTNARTGVSTVEVSHALIRRDTGLAPVRAASMRRRWQVTDLHPLSDRGQPCPYV